MAPESNLEIGKRLRWTRLALGMSQVGIARELMPDDEYAAQVWNNWEKGRDRPSVDSALLMVKKYRLSLDWIYVGDDSMLPSHLAKAIAEARTKDSKAA